MPPICIFGGSSTMHKIPGTGSVKIAIHVCLAFAFLPCQLLGSGDATQIPRLIAPIAFDGTISSGEWDAVDTLSLVSHWPVYSEKPNGRTHFRVAYDENFFYFSALCFDSPELIQGPSFERDNWAMNMDQVAIILDTYNDNENGLIFVVTPTGSRVDASLKNDAQASEPTDESWNSFWETKVSLHDQGWSAESRIPFSSLRFQESGGTISMGLIAYRYISRERQLDTYPGISPEWGFWSFIKPSQSQNVSFSNIDHKRPWFTSPYVLAGSGYHHIIPEGSTLSQKKDDDKITVGLDVQHAVTDNLNLDLTVNTDFAQVEADEQVVNLSRFSLFFPEKRRFFLERSSIMEFGFEGNNRLFYSRRIGIEDGQITPLWGGARLVGRVKDYDVGFMTMQSRSIDDIPSENFGVLRLRRKISDNNSYLGGILTTRTDWKGNLNLAYGVDGIINLFGNDYLKVNLARSSDNADTNSYADVFDDRKRIHLVWENRAQVGFNYSLSYSQVDKEYAPGLGFEARKDFKAIGDRISYGWFPANTKSLRAVKVDLNAVMYISGTTHKIETVPIAPSIWFEWKKNSSLRFSFSRVFDNVPEAFDLSDEIEIASGKYINKDFTIGFETPSVNFLTSIFEVTAGNFYGGDRISGSITPTYIISRYLTLSGFYQFNQIAFPDGPDYVAHVGRLKIATSMNVKLSINTFIQYNSLSKVSAINFRLRYNPKDGNDLYFVYNELLNGDGRDDPDIPFSDYRALIVKYVYTFHLGK